MNHKKRPFLVLFGAGGHARSCIDVIEQSKLYRILSAGDIYDPDRVNYDKDLLRRYYLEAGYADFIIKSTIAEITKDNKNFFITFSIDEGEKYKFGNVKFQTTNKSFDQKIVDEIISPLKNSSYNIKKIDTAIKEIKQYAGKIGYAFLEVKPKLNRN